MRQLRFPLIITLSLSVIHVQAQNEDNIQKTVGELFGNGTNRDAFGNLIEVPTSTPGSIGSLEKCGQGSQEETHKCVPYFQCDGTTRMIIQDGSKNGIGIIDIRFGANACVDYLDVCCGIPEDLRGPGPVVPVNPPISSDRPPVTPVNPPVTPVGPPITPSVTPVTPVSPRPSSLLCGIRNSEGIEFKITGNRNNEAEYGEFPWMMAILWKSFDPTRGNTLSICGGSLIAPNIVLTGAHCVADLQVNQYKVRAGEWDTQTEKERYPYQERDVAQVIIHENYTPKVVYNDVALLVLSSPFDMSNNIGTICLPTQNEVITSRNCFASGWGKKVFGKEGNYQVILKKIELPMVQHGECQEALRRTRLGQIFSLHPSFTCAGGELGKDTCTGDGGSPLICPDPQNPTRYVQSGIVSWGIGCGEEKIPGVYANVAKFRTWIDGQLSRLSINTDSYIV